MLKNQLSNEQRAACKNELTNKISCKGLLSDDDDYRKHYCRCYCDNNFQRIQILFTLTKISQIFSHSNSEPKSLKKF